MPIGYIRVLDPKVRKQYGFSQRHDKVRVNQEGHPLHGLILYGSIAHCKSKSVENGFVELVGVGKKRKEVLNGKVDVDFLLSFPENQALLKEFS